MISKVDIEEWARCEIIEPLPAAKSYLVRLWDGDGFDEKRSLNDATPTGAQVLSAFDRHPVNEHALLLLDNKGLHEVEPNEVVDIGSRRAERFFAFRTDRLWFASFNERRFSWGGPEISERMLRLVFRVPVSEKIVYAKEGRPDHVLLSADCVSLESSGLERFYTRPSVWKLLVQGVTLEFDKPLVVVKDALIKAGLDPEQGWTAVLKFVGKPKESVCLNDTIDLSRPGIEKLWLRPNHVNNGEATAHIGRAFRLRDADEAYLQHRGLQWETVLEGAVRWFILRGYVLPEGYQQAEVDIAVLIPPTYPAAQLDMFYCAPHLALTLGGKIPCTDNRQLIAGVSYQRWSRHRHADTTWNPTVDSLISHLALIDDAIAREVEGAQ